MSGRKENYFKHFLQIVGPIVLSASSLFVCFHIIQPLALYLDSTFSLLANRGIGKIAMTVLVIVHLLMLAFLLPKSFFSTFLRNNLFALTQKGWPRRFFGMFVISACLHVLFLSVFCFSSYAFCDWPLMSLVPSKIPNLLWAFVATFFLAWTEEAIFRGTIYPFFLQSYTPIVSMFFTSFIFSLSHNLTNPLALVGSQWQLGLGLFLLGFLLNVLFFLSNDLVVNMGAHAGLVYIKVFLRRIPLLVYAPLPWWLDIDLRKSFLVHVLFTLVIVSLLFYVRHQRQYEK